MSTNRDAEVCEQNSSVEEANVQDNEKLNDDTQDIIVQDNEDQVSEKEDKSKTITTLSVPSDNEEKASLVATVSNNVKGFVAKYYPICKKYVVSAAKFCKEKIIALIEKIKKYIADKRAQ